MVVGGADDASEATLIVRINTICQFWSGLCRTCAGSGCSPTRRCERDLLDMLCARLEQLMRHEEGRDLVTLQHKFVVVWKGGSEVCAPPPHFYFFPRVMSMIMFAANARFHAGRVRPPRRALRNGTHRWPAVRHHGAARAPRGNIQPLSKCTSRRYGIATRRRSGDEKMYVYVTVWKCIMG